MKKLKVIASHVRLITCLLLQRNFGNIFFRFPEYKNSEENISGPSSTLKCLAIL